MDSNSAIRLAPLGGIAANSYNVYHFVTQVAGLYAHAADFDHREHVGKIWMELSMLMIGDISLIYNVWEKAHNLERIDEDDEEFGQYILRTCKRVDRLVDLMDVWTPVVRWARIMRLLERRHREILGRFLAFNSPYEKIYKKLVEDSVLRDQKLDGLLQLYQVEAERFEEPNKLKQAPAVVEKAQKKDPASVAGEKTESRDSCDAQESEQPNLNPGEIEFE